MGEILIKKDDNWITVVTPADLEHEESITGHSFVENIVIPNPWGFTSYSGLGINPDNNRELYCHATIDTTWYLLGLDLDTYQFSIISEESSMPSGARVFAKDSQTIYTYPSSSGNVYAYNILTKTNSVVATTTYSTSGSIAYVPVNKMICRISFNGSSSTLYRTNLVSGTTGSTTINLGTSAATTGQFVGTKDYDNLFIRMGNATTNTAGYFNTYRYNLTTSTLSTLSTTYSSDHRQFDYMMLQDLSIYNNVFIQYRYQLIDNIGTRTSLDSRNENYGGGTKLLSVPEDQILTDTPNMQFLCDNFLYYRMGSDQFNLIKSTL